MFSFVRSFRAHTLAVAFGAFDEPGERFITGSYDKTVVVWNVSDGKTLFVLQGHTKVVYCGAFNPPGNRVCTGSFDKTARVWDACTGICMHILRGHQSEVIVLTWNQTGDLVATGSMDNTCRVWHAQQGTLVNCLTDHTAEIMSVSWNMPICDKILTASLDATAIVWEVCSGRRLHTLSGHQQGVHCAVFECTGKFCITGSQDGACRLWDLSSGGCVHTACEHTDEVLDICFNCEGTHFASGSADFTTIVYEIESQTLTVALISRLVGHEHDISRVKFLPEEPHILSSSLDRTCRLWDWKSGICLQVFDGHTDSVFEVCSNAGGTILSTLSKDDTCRHWERLSSLIVILTQRPSEPGRVVPILCTGLSGNELATIRVEAGGAQDMAWFREVLAKQLQVHPWSLQCMNAKGELLKDVTHTLLDAIAD